MTGHCLKLTAYLGERDRSNGGFAADALTDIYARHELRASVLLRGAEGFGAGGRRRTDRQLSLSEDLPVVSVAVDARERIESVLQEVEDVPFNGLLTVERARILTGGAGPVALAGPAKLTVYVGRRDRAEGLVALLRAHGVDGATVLLGVDGTAHGARERARFLDRNARVPVMVIAVGDGDRIARALPQLAERAPHAVVTLERVIVCKRDGRLLAQPHAAGSWQKLMVVTGEQARHDGRPLHLELVRALRRAGAAGATSLRGVWGYHGAHEPHGDRFLQVRRRVPVVTVIVDTPDRMRRWYAIVDRLTARTGLVTSELVPDARLRRG